MNVASRRVHLAGATPGRTPAIAALSRRGCGPRRQRGFSLIEVILAFSLLAVSLGILVAILSGGLAQVKQAGDATEAALHAQSLMDEVGTLAAIAPGVSQGELDQGRYRWRLEISPAEDPAPAASLLESGVAPIETVGLQPVGEPVLYRVQLDLTWGEDDYARSLRVATLRARTPPDPGGLP